MITSATRDGNINLDYDFGMEGNLDVTANLGGDGMSEIMADDELTYQSFSYTNIAERMKLFYGTPYQVNQGRSPTSVIATNTDDDPYEGFLRLGSGGGEPQTVAFDQSGAPAEHILAEFDFRMVDELLGEDDGLSFLLMPTELYGENGPLEDLGPEFSAVQPSLFGGIGVGIQPFAEGWIVDAYLRWGGNCKHRVLWRGVWPDVGISGIKLTSRCSRRKRVAKYWSGLTNLENERTDDSYQRVH